jgi:hypothetical protein
MAKRQVFYSFHYKPDVFRVQQIRNMGVIEGNPAVAPNAWESITTRGDTAIKQWIEDNMFYKSCIIVLVGSETASRKWVQYEIKKAWNDRKGLVGIYIHNLSCPTTGTCKIGANPFSHFRHDGIGLDEIVQCYNPTATNAYNVIKYNLTDWIEEAIQIRRSYD